MEAFDSGSAPEGRPTSAIRIHPRVLAQALDGLDGSGPSSQETVLWLFRDPALAARILDLHAHATGPAGALLKNLAGSDLSAWLAGTTLEFLADGFAPETPACWEKALTTAHLCRALALMLGYPDPWDAYLAGLLHNLDRPGPSCGGPLARPDFRRTADRLAGWRHSPALAGAIRAQAEDDQRLAGALPLSRLLRTARAMAGDEPGADALAAILLPTLASAELAAAHDEAADAMARIQGTLAETTLPASDRLVQALQGHMLLTRTRSALDAAATEAAALDAAAGILSDTFQVHHPLYLAGDRQSYQLRPHASHESRLPGLHITIPGSNSAAAWAWTSGEAVVFSTRDTESDSLLDEQLAQMYGLDAVLAIPVGAPIPEGVLLACLEAGQAARLERSAPYLRQFGRLLGHALGRVRARPADPAAEAVSHHRSRVRQAAHEINNPLGIARNYLAILTEKLASAGQPSGELAIIRQELERIPHIIRALAEDDTTGLTRREKCQVNNLVRDLATITESSAPAGHRVRIVTRLSPDLPAIHTDAGKLKQLLINLMLNAQEASPDDSEIDVVTGTCIDHLGNRQMTIVIADHGHGIPPEKLQRLFEPKLSDKESRHQGLGLAIVKTLAGELGMTVTCSSGEDGTTFRIAIPLAAHEASSMRHAAGLPA